MNLYSEDEMNAIRQHETAVLAAAHGTFESARLDFDDAEPARSRWQRDGFAEEVDAARRRFAGWFGWRTVIAASVVLNCVLVQEITPDLRGLVERWLPVTPGLANILATGILTGLLFAILFAVKRMSDLAPELAGLRPGLHPAVLRPLRRRIGRKVMIKLGYLTLSGIGYLALYRYVAAGHGMEQDMLEAVRDLRKMGEAGLGGSQGGEPAGNIVTDAPAASYAVYYALEWLVHAMILFIALPGFPAGGFRRLLLWERRDEKRYREARRQLLAVSGNLRQLCQPRHPDDGVNDLRRHMLEELEGSAAPPAPGHGRPDRPDVNGRTHPGLVATGT